MAAFCRSPTSHAKAPHLRPQGLTMNVAPRRSRAFHSQHRGPLHCDPPQAAENQSPNQGERGTILVLDTDPDQLGQLCQVLVSQGYLCHACPLPGDALVTVAQTAIDVFICSMELAGENSIALYDRMLAASPQYVPAIFLSSAQSADVIRRQYGTRGAYFLRRPWNPEVLTSLIENLHASQPLVR